MLSPTTAKTTRRLDQLIAINNQSMAAIEVSGLQLDSRKVSAGDLFVACKGHAVDGRNYIDEAIAAGAMAVVADKDDIWTEDTVLHGVPVIVLENLASRLSQIAGNFFQHPSSGLAVLAVTGTNGKTSCTQLLMQLLNLLDHSCAVIGTLGAGVDGEFDNVSNTTPDAITIQQYLARWRDQQVTTVAMEISSHGLEQGRVSALQFELALFTNLSRDHLDYHGSMQAYAMAKARLFQQPGLKIAVINCDDDFSVELMAMVSAGVELIAYSTAGQRQQSVDVWVEDVDYHSEGVSCNLRSPWGQFKLNSPLLGAFNLSNVVAVITCLGALKYSLDDVVAALPGLGTVPGRMQRITPPADITVVVDYAHTPDALEQALLAMRLHTTGKLWCVFGCGGDRDQGKRQHMGEIAQSHADHVVVTSDNPRSESMRAIIDEILGGVDCPTMVEEDRGMAIDAVIANAKPGDSVLIAGKGHEQYQQVGDQLLPFSDIDHASIALSKRSLSAGGEL